MHPRGFSGTVGRNGLKSFPVIEFDGNHAADAGLRHRDAIHRVGQIHRALVVGDENKLGTDDEFLENVAKTLHVGLVT